MWKKLKMRLLGENKDWNHALMQICFHMYLLVMFGVYPLYMGDGYYMMTDHKFKLYTYVHLYFFSAMSVLILFRFLKNLIREFKEDGCKIEEEAILWPSLFLIGYFVSIWVSTYFSIANQFSFPIISLFPIFSFVF